MTSRDSDETATGRKVARKPGDRAARLAAALRANLQRRKAQARLRGDLLDAGTDGDGTHDSGEFKSSGSDDPDTSPPTGLRKPEPT